MLWSSLVSRQIASCHLATSSESLVASAQVLIALVTSESIPVLCITRKSLKLAKINTHVGDV